DIELPSVVHAAQSALLVAAEEQRDQPVRTALVEQPDPPPRIAERHQLLAEQLDAHGRAIRLWQLPGKERWDPVPAHRFAHRRTAPDVGDSLVVFSCQHVRILLAGAAIADASLRRESSESGAASS